MLRVLIVLFSPLGDEATKSCFRRRCSAQKASREPLSVLALIVQMLGLPTCPSQNFHTGGEGVQDRLLVWEFGCWRPGDLQQNVAGKAGFEEVLLLRSVLLSCFWDVS